jgi:hypothetical protein
MTIYDKFRKLNPNVIRFDESATQFIYSPKGVYVKLVYYEGNRAMLTLIRIPNEYFLYD